MHAGSVRGCWYCIATNRTGKQIAARQSHSSDILGPVVQLGQKCVLVLSVVKERGVI